jgi:uncharacterized protein GlcG (DUF336 family)
MTRSKEISIITFEMMTSCASSGPARVARNKQKGENIMNLAEAKNIIDAAHKKADEMGLPMCIAVMDSNVYLVAFVRTGDTTLDSIQIATDKAYISALIRMTTRELGIQCQPGAPLYGFQNNLNGRLVIFPGGLPLWQNNQLVGAIGVSGGLVDQDEAVALGGASLYSTVQNIT